MKNKILLICLVATLFLLTGCGHINRSTYEVNDEFVVLEVKKDSITKNGATFILTNKTEETYDYDNNYIIEEYKKGHWYSLNDISNGDEPVFSLVANGFINLKVNWEEKYGSLDKGKYRLIKKVFREKSIPITSDDLVYVAAEFNIE